MPYLPADAPLTLSDLSGITRPPEALSPDQGWLPAHPTFFSSGRAALFCALDALGIGRGDEVLLPSYLCESVVTPVLARGATPRFYRTGRALHPDLAALDAAIGPHTRAIVVIHYLGFPAPIEAIGAICSSRGVALIEDCAHALFSRLGDRLLGSFGAASVWSPWKTLPLPDGGLLALNGASPSPCRPLARPPPLTSMARLAYRALGGLETRLGWTPRLLLLRRAGVRHTLHRRTSGAAVVVRRGAPISWRLLQTARPERVVARRREHFLRLLDAVRRAGWASPIFEDLPAGVCPLGLPIVAERRDRWRDLLLSRGVNVRTYWEQLPGEVDTGRFPHAAWLRDRILVLPVHQGLSTSQVEWLAEELSAVGRQPSVPVGGRKRTPG
jgi:dTDP-4-amino-4,6-dideoxygalactose transaminase